VREPTVASSSGSAVQRLAVGLVVQVLLEIDDGVTWPSVRIDRRLTASLASDETGVDGEEDRAADQEHEHDEEKEEAPDVHVPVLPLA
jgi:hypothetical protein